MTRFVRAGVAMGFVLALLVAVAVRASDAPTGAYAKTLTFTLSTATP